MEALLRFLVGQMQGAELGDGKECPIKFKDKNARGGD